MTDEQTVVPQQGRGYGWLPDLPDVRDFSFDAVALADQITVPDVVDLRPKCPPVYDQGQLGSCTANSVAFALDFERQKQNESLITPSRLFIYYNEREAQGTIMSDSGSSIRQSVREVLHQGACPESEWAYDLTKWNVKPDQKCYTDGVQFEAIQYQRVNRSLNDLQIALAAGNPVLIGFTVYSSFETPGVAKTGQMTMPGAGESVLGGHAVSVVGYDRTKKVWICRNSWGTGWGDQGYFYMPFDYLLNSSLSSDFWVLRSVK